MPNIERLTALLEYVEKLPVEQIDMQSFRNECGTTACLMGHAVSAFPDQLMWTKDNYIGRPFDPMAGDENYPGTVFFDLTESQWQAIFNDDIPNDRAVKNLREHVESWERAQATK